MDVRETKLPGVLQIIPPTVFRDERGEYVEPYNEQLYKEAGIDMHFVQDDFSVSKKHVLRGLHGDSTTYKLITCVYGAFYLVVANFDESSDHYLKWVSFSMSEDERIQVLVPPNHAVGHLVLSDKAIFGYKQSTYYNRESQFTVLWNDERLAIDWPIAEPILSQRDSGAL